MSGDFVIDTQEQEHNIEADLFDGPFQFAYTHFLLLHILYLPYMNKRYCASTDLEQYEKTSFGSGSTLGRCRAQPTRLRVSGCKREDLFRRRSQPCHLGYRPEILRRAGAFCFQ